MAPEKVKERLRRATKALDDASLPYAVAGGNAVAEWVARVDKDKVHLLDLIGVGLIDAGWPARFPPPLGERLQQLLDNPNR
jgi:hypothetical protein